ncbi:MAG: DNA mismatch repair endonuclease MutL [Thermodesulfobacteriota bacterium]
MSKIQILPEHLANRIAAGEVVERPASVVKELLENSLDAGASRIEVEIEGGGTRLIRIIDDGEGMSEDDVLLCLERHGTSKISGDDDLDGIHTLGFRGEAIPSIGSVSKMTITSREKGKPLGTTAVIDYGRLNKIHEAGCSPGTTMEVRNLFGNTPARKKFLRTRKTELAHIDQVVRNYCLAASGVAFILRIDGRETINIDAALDLKQRVEKVISHHRELLPVGGGKASRERISVFGYLVAPEEAPSGANRLRLFVNGRAVKDRMMAHGVSEGFRGFLMKGKSPAGFLHLRIPPTDVDVNVHPAKNEVRFREGQLIHQLISTAVQRALGEYQSTLQHNIFLSREDSPDYSTASGTMDREPPPPPPRSITQPQREAPAPLPFDADRSDRLQPRTHPFKPPQESREVAAIAKPTPSGNSHSLLIIGQYENLYIFCQSPDGLVIIDQHAAHERLLFEELKKQYLDNRLQSQSLLFPITVELSISEAQLTRDRLQEIERMGFRLREFGGNSWVITAVPGCGGDLSAEELFFDLLARLGADSRLSGSLIDDILASMACKAAVKSGDNLQQEEMEGLIERMFKADLFSHCPHGRPVIKQFNPAEIKKWFHRT